MVIRSYTADSVASALKQVRSDMGGNAVVLKTRVMNSAESGKTYEVTACLDKPTVEQANQTLAPKVPRAPVATAVVDPEAGTVFEEITFETRPAATNPRVDLTEAAVTPPPATPSDTTPDTDRWDMIESKLDQLLKVDTINRIGRQFVPESIVQAVRSMQQADVPERCIAEIIDEFRSNAPDSGDDPRTIRQALVKRLEDCIEPDLDIKPGDRVIVAGPAGSGKTSLIGRLTAWLTFEKMTTVKLISLDNVKVGARDEIASYADLLGVDEVTTPDNLQNETDAQDDDKVVLIDTSALPSDPKQLAELQAQVDILKPTLRLAVFSTLTRSSDIEKFANRMTWLAPTHLAFTMIDQTDSVGSLLAGATALDTKIALITQSSSGADSFHRPDAEALADLILGGEADSE